MIANTFDTSTGITTAIDHLKQLIRYRIKKELHEEEVVFPEFQLDPNSIFGKFIIEQQLYHAEIIPILLALVPMLSPKLFENVITEFLPAGGEFPEFGGIKGKNHRGIIPTGETALYILAGNDLEKRTSFMKIFDEDAALYTKGILSIASSPIGEPVMSGILSLDQQIATYLLTGIATGPKLTTDFPAQKISTALAWKDLVLQEKTLSQILEIETWLKYNQQFLEEHQMAGRVKPGYRVMFHGPPGTGKTLTATLLGKYTNREVYRIDLSMVVSKYIGETEKNLSKLFDKARHRNWILFFDEADAIFGKRTNVRDAHDKYANQEVSYLLQRIEAHPGLVVLASNQKNNIDSAFTRRFQSIIYFENPGPKERVLLWKNNLPKGMHLHKKIDIDRLAKTYEITGSNIINIIQFAALETLKKESTTLLLADLIAGIKKEYVKEGKML